METQVIGPEAADDVVTVVHAGFGAREVLDPPSSAPDETTASVATALAEHGGVLVSSELGPVGALIFEPLDDDHRVLGLRRVAVHPDAQGRGVARALVRRAEREAAERGYVATRVLARAELPRTQRFWQRLGYVETGREHPMVTLMKVLPVTVETRSGDEARALGEALAPVLQAGDLLILTGDLGAGKTTFTQGIGAGLGVRGDVTSPTFVISRVHPSLGDGPPLVHVDAYRLSGGSGAGVIDELDDLDLDASLDEAVTVVEWGEGVAEGLADTRLEVRIKRARGDEAEDKRTVTFVPVGARWVDADLRKLLTGALA